MRLLQRSALPLACALLAAAPAGAARAADYELVGAVAFSNVQAGTQPGGIVPYFGVGYSSLTGPNVQTGTIRNLTGLIPVNATTFMFLGEVGPHYALPGQPEVHLISTLQGNIHCTWTAVFTLTIVSAQGDAVLSGDGDFTVTGGTGRYRNATGSFRTLFETAPVPPGADQAVAGVTQSGTINRR